MIKKIFVILVAAVICLSVSVCASAYTYQYINDDLSKLSYTEYDELEAIAESLESSYGLCIMFCISDGTSGLTDYEYAQQVYAENTDNENGVIILNNDADKTYAVLLSGNAEELLDENKVENMRKAYDENNSYYEGIYACYSLAEDYLENGSYASPDDTLPEKIDEPGETDDVADEKDGVPFFWIPVSLVIGLFTGFLIINSIASKNKSVRMQKNATVYTRPGSMIITGSADNFLYNNVERREKLKQTENQKN